MKDERRSNVEIQPYLFFNGRCEEAVEFYRKALDAEVEMLMRNKESPEGTSPHMPPGSENKILHGCIRIQGSAILVSDGNAQDGTKFEGFSISLGVNDRPTAERWFKALSAGGQVTLPLGKTFWSPLFGMVKDRFGVGWMIGLTE
jgi:PhnB protein